MFVSADEVLERLDLSDYELSKFGYSHDPDKIFDRSDWKLRLVAVEKAKKAFKKDIEMILCIEKHPKANMMFDIAWELGHVDGYGEIVHTYLKLLQLVDECPVSTKHMINSFDGDFCFLSNFAESEVEYDGIVYPTVEHAFQAAKTMDIGERKKIANISTPGKAKRAGRNVDLRPDWEDVKIGVMEELVRKKFSVQPFTHMLLSTGQKELVEGNNWNDTFWGVCRGKGKNNLGKILMRVRGELRLS